LERSFFSRGKLLLTGEYAVLQNATSVAVPTILGQSLKVSSISSNERILHWKAYDVEARVWFSGQYHLNNNKFAESTDMEIANRLEVILTEARKHSNFLENGSFSIETKLDFPTNYGLGSSSTLINNIALWANIDPYKLLSSSFGGSGFDLAVAQANSPIRYWLKAGQPNWNQLNYHPKFTNELWFIHLNEKAVSREAIKKDFAFNEMQINKISKLSEKLLELNRISELEALIEEHERIVSEVLGIKTVKERLFSNFHRSVKSLGAWGGDFVLVTATEEELSYFRSEGYNSIFNYSELILNNEREGR
jgi:mevalonate kinase